MDADSAGDAAAAELAAWFDAGAPARRLRPPEPFKDWNEALQALGPAGVADELRRQYPALPLQDPTAYHRIAEDAPTARQDAPGLQEPAEVAVSPTRAESAPRDSAHCGVSAAEPDPEPLDLQALGNLAAVLWQRATRHGFPALRGKGWTVAAGAAAWRVFVADPDMPHDRALNALAIGCWRTPRAAAPGCADPWRPVPLWPARDALSRRSHDPLFHL